jgi:hypothetical protein
MAGKLGFSASYLSAIELGRRCIPDDIIINLTALYGLDKISVQILERYKALDSKTIRISLESASPAKCELALLFAKEFKELDGLTMTKIVKVLEKNAKKA